MSAKAKSSKHKKNGRRFKDPMAVTWTEKYGEVLDNIWDKLPGFLKPTIVTIAVFLLGSSIKGEWILIGVHLLKHFGFYDSEHNTTLSWDNLTLESLHLKNVHQFIIGASTVSYTMYFVIGGFIHWNFYMKQRDKAHEWKCQPKKFLDPKLELHEIVLGSCSLLLTNSISGILACFIANGGWSMVYYEFGEYGWWWYFLQWPVIFIFEDYATYWFHRIYHWPFLYRNFHKLHHKYKQPTAFSVTAIHPVEIVNLQLILCLPLFTIPVHWTSFYVINIYIFYHGIIDHSGVNFKSYWWQPWQPDAIFHDNHHQYFHVNFAFNMGIWDKLHGTERKKDRIYTEDIYFGQGKSITEASEKELKDDIAERKSENPLAYRSNKLDFDLKAEDIKKNVNGKKKVERKKNVEKENVEKKEAKKENQVKQEENRKKQKSRPKSKSKKN